MSENRLTVWVAHPPTGMMLKAFLKGGEKKAPSKERDRCKVEKLGVRWLSQALASVTPCWLTTAWGLLMTPLPLGTL